MPEADAIEAAKPVAPRWPNPPDDDDKQTYRKFVMPKRQALPRILEHQLPSGEFARNLWIAQPDANVTHEDMLRADFWTHVAKKLRRGDRIEALSYDTSWFLELIVRSSNGREVEVRELRHISLGALTARNPDEYEITQKPIGKWRIMRKVDKVVLQEGLLSEAAAAAWLATPISDKA